MTRLPLAALAAVLRVLSTVVLLHLAALPAQAEGTDRCAIARWLFNGSGWDEMGYHPITLHGGATFVPTCGSDGLFTSGSDSSNYGTYPPFGEMPSGTIAFQFELETPFHADPAYNDPITFIGSNRVGHLVGDIGVRLDPEDGRLWLVQEHPIVGPDWLLKSTKSYWEAGVCFRVEIEWGPTGRKMKVATPGYFEMNSDDVVRDHAFSLDATLTKVLYRDDAGTPPTGVKLDWLEVACPCPPVGTQPTSWGLVKALYR